MTETMNQALADLGDPDDHFVSAAACRVLKRSEW
jgi:hypothetical protein